VLPALDKSQLPFPMIPVFISFKSMTANLGLCPLLGDNVRRGMCLWASMKKLEVVFEKPFMKLLKIISLIRLIYIILNKEKLKRKLFNLVQIQ
jgi:TctA family transporter